MMLVKDNLLWANVLIRTIRKIRFWVHDHQVISTTKYDNWVEPVFGVVIWLFPMESNPDSYSGPSSSSLCDYFKTQLLTLLNKVLSIKLSLIPLSASIIFYGFNSLTVYFFCASDSYLLKKVRMQLCWSTTAWNLWAFASKFED